MEKSATAFSYVPDHYWKTALYIRLSKEDYNAGDSISVQHQRKILRQYAKDKGFYVVDEFVDDGYSGTNFERPAFQRMLDYIKKKKINCVITKDLSRLGRNHLEVGYYIETFFPDNQIRYISVNEQYDSLNGDSDLVPFMNIFNEMYAKQSSKKNRQVFESKFHSGGMHSAHVSYGYLKDPNNKDHRIVDEEVSWVVEKIYDLALCGDGPLLIQKWLYENRIECPSYRIFARTGMFADRFEEADDEKKYLWSVGTIRRILTDTVYLGHSVHYKKRRPSYKHKKQRYLPEEAWLVKENTHEPIIAQETFDAVQKIVAERKRTTKTGELSLFAGLLRCSDCGGAMACYKRNGKNGSQSYYVCSKNSQRNVGGQCSAHYIREDVLSDIILGRIQALFAAVKIDKTSLIRKLTRADETDSEKTLRQAQEELAIREKRKRTLLKLLGKVYEDWVEERIAESNFRMLSENYQAEQAEIDARIGELQTTLKRSETTSDPVNRFVDTIESLLCPSELTRDILFALIDRIIVYEAEKGKPGKRNKTQRIDIHWKYIGVN